MEEVIDRVKSKKTLTSTNLNSKISSAINTTLRERMQNLRKYLFGNKLDIKKNINSNSEFEH